MLGPTSPSERPKLVLLAVVLLEGVKTGQCAVYSVLSVQCKV